MNSATFARLSLTILGLTAAAAAQTLGPCPPEHLDTLELRNWASRHLHDGAIKGMVRGNLTGTGYSDFVFLCGGDPILAVAPALVHQIVTLPGTAGMTVNELCLVSQPGNEDSVAMLGTQGLHIWSRGTGSTYGEIQGLGGPTWSAHSNLRHSPSSHRLLTAGPNRDTIAWIDATTGDTGGFNIYDPILTFEVLDWDGDQHDDLFVVTTEGMAVYNLSGDLVTRHATPISEAISTTMQTPLGDMASVVCRIYGYKWLVTSGSLWYEATPVNEGVASVSAGSLQPDGWNELSVGYSNSADLGVLVNTTIAGEMFSFTPGNGVNVPFQGAATPTNNRATANIADYDGDGYGDLFYPIESGSQVAVARSPFAPTGAPTPRYVGVYYYGHGADNLTLSLDTSIEAPQAATHLEVITWFAHVDENQIVTEAGRVDTVSANLIDHFAPPTIDTLVPFGLASHDGLMMMLRFVEFDGAVRERVWPPEFAFVTVDDNVFNVAVQQGMNTVPGGIGGSSTGGVASHGSLPPPQDANDDALPVVR